MKIKADALRAAIKADGRNNAEISRAAGLNDGYLSHIIKSCEQGYPVNPARTSMAQVCKALNIPLEEIEVGKTAEAPLTADEYQRLALRTAETLKHGNERLLNGLMGLCGESGECIDLLKKYFYQGHDLDEAKLADELGDVAWYLALAADALGLTLSEVMRRNIEKLKKRYPDGFSEERSKNRV